MASLKVTGSKSRLNVQSLCLPKLAAPKIVHGVDNVQNSTKNIQKGCVKASIATGRPSLGQSGDHYGC
ncbi:MAG: hypothetical protein LBP55_00495, partial [Candidatus Adiutrix sp.]|nr:hypothetical protein [Candidatus Adiutrix sp.]